MRRYLPARPEGYGFAAGQATEIALDAEGRRDERIDGRFIDRHLPDAGGSYYLCGPDPMTEASASALAERGANADKVLIAS